MYIWIENIVPCHLAVDVLVLLISFDELDGKNLTFDAKDALNDSWDNDFTRYVNVWQIG